MENCLFCKIIDGEIPSAKVFENDKLIAFNDINPKAKVHILIVPKKHIESVKHLQEIDKELAGELILVAQKIAKEIAKQIQLLLYKMSDHEVYSLFVDCFC